MNLSPKISIIMSVFNAEWYLKESIESILAQSYSDFEFIVVDDASTDNSLAILEQYAAADKRISIIKNDTNIGLTKSLNKCLKVVKGMYIARQDADDISFPDRLERQIVFLDKNSNIGLLGSFYQTIDNDGEYINTTRTPVTHFELFWCQLFNNAFCHSAVMFRRSVFKQSNLYYDSNLKFSQDMDLWWRMLNTTNGASLPEVLVSFRRHSGSISNTKTNEQLQVANNLVRRNLEFIDRDHQLSEGEIIFFRLLAKGNLMEINPEDWTKCEEFLGIMDQFCEYFKCDSRTKRFIVFKMMNKWLMSLPFSMLFRKYGLGLIKTIFKRNLLVLLYHLPLRLSRRFFSETR